MRVLNQVGFDPIGPAVHTRSLATGRTFHYIDEGQPDWPVLLFFGGAGTSVRAFRLLEFARTLREELRVRVISVERNGLGQTPYQPFLGLDEYSADIWTLLDELTVGRVAVVAISGGGPYAARVMAAQPDRIASVHLACAYAEPLNDDPPVFDLDEVSQDPAGWWRFPDASSVHEVPGFAEAAQEEGTYALLARGRDTSPFGLAQAFDIYRTVKLPELKMLAAPCFLYWGENDALVPLGHLNCWREALPGPVTVRCYEGEGHDVQYRHWDQILCDVAYLGEQTIISQGGRTALVHSDEAAAHLARGAKLGLAAWSGYAR